MRWFFPLLLLFRAFPAAAMTDMGEIYERIRSQAAARSPEIATAREVLRQKSAQVRTSWAHWIPRVDVQLSQTKSQDFSLLTTGQIPTFFQGYVPPVVDLGMWALKTTVPLYRRSVYLEVEQSSREKHLAQSQLDAKLADFDWRLRELVGNYLLAAYRVATIDSSLEIAETNQRETKTRFALGQRTRIDLLRSEANVLSLESKKLGYREDMASAYSSLAELSGLTDDELGRSGLAALVSDEATLESAVGAFSGVERILPPLRPFLDESARPALAQRLSSQSPSYATIQAQGDVELAQAAGLMAESWPDFSFQAQIYKQSPGWGRLFNGSQNSFSIGVTLTIPISLGGGFFSTATQMAAASKAAELKRAKDTFKLLNDIENQRLKIRSLLANVDSLKATRDQNEEIVKLSVKSYNLGKTTLVELLVSQNDLIESKMGYAKGRIDLSVLLRRFAASLGVTPP